MRTTIISLTCASALALSACVPGTEDEVTGALVGAVFGGITAKALKADRDWVIIGALAGAAAGTLIARNSQTNECAYARGDGTYYRAPCPRP